MVTVRTTLRSGGRAMAPGSSSTALTAPSALSSGASAVKSRSRATTKGMVRPILRAGGGHILCPGGYDGDGTNDFAVWRPSNGTWFIINSSNGAQRTQQWGVGGEVPVTGDYEGDGKTDFAGRRWPHPVSGRVRW